MAAALAAAMLASSCGPTAGAGCSVTDVHISGTPATFAVAQTAVLTATLNPACSSAVVTWTSSNPAVATVSSSGLLTAVAPGGPVNIAASSGTGHDTVAVTVTASTTIVEVDVTPSPVTLAPSEVSAFTAVAKTQSGATSPASFTWTNSEELPESGPYFIMVVGPSAVGLRATLPGQPAAIVASVLVPNAARGNALITVSTPTLYTGHLFATSIAATSGFSSMQANGTGLAAVNSGDPGTPALLDVTADGQTAVYTTQLAAPTASKNLKLWTSSVTGQSRVMLAIDSLKGPHHIGGVALSNVAPYRVAYLQGTVGSADTLYSVKLDGTDLRILAVVGTVAGNPVWDQTATHVLFIGTVGGGPLLAYSANADASGFASIAAGAAPGASYWSPDRSQYVYAVAGALFKAQALVGVGIPIALPTYLVPTGTSMSWSPDGSTLAFLADSATRRSAYLINADGSGLRLINDESALGGKYQQQATSVGWSPDGQSIIFGGCMKVVPTPCDTVFGASIGVVRADGSHLTLISPLSNTVYLAPIWRP
jgi:WD40 repeat protein